jgi:hypothetical protein
LEDQFSHHNLGIMLIEKNVFENIFNTVMEMKGKTKKNIKAKTNIYLFYHCKKMKLVYDGSWTTKPNASFGIEKNAQLLIYQ